MAIRQTQVSTILATTRNESLDKVAEDARLGEIPMPHAFEKTKLRFGEVRITMETIRNTINRSIFYTENKIHTYNTYRKREKRKIRHYICSLRVRVHDIVILIRA